MAPPQNPPLKGPHDDLYHYTVFIGIALAVVPYMLMRVGSTNDFLEALGVRQLYDHVDMAQELAFSRVRHTSSINKIIHMVTNPVIFLTELVLLDYTPPLIDLPAGISKYFTLNLAGVYLVFFVAYYMSIDPFAGTFASLYLVWRYACIGRFGRMVEKIFGDKQRASTIALGLYVFCNFLQIVVGHIYLEQFYDINLYQTFFLQQLIAIYEILFKVDARLGIGYLDEFDAQIESLLDAEMEEMLGVDAGEAPEF